MTDLWKIQPIDAQTPSLDEIHRLAASLQTTVDRRNRFGLMIAIVEVFVFTGMWMAFPNHTQRIGCAWTVAGLLYMSAQLLWRPAARPASDLGLAACLEFQRRELARQRDFHRGWWFWSRFIAFVPGPGVFGAGAIMASSHVRIDILLVGVVYVAIAAWAIPLNLRLAQSYQRQIDQLPSHA